MLLLDVGLTIFLNEISAILENTREGHAGLLPPRPPNMEERDIFMSVNYKKFSHGPFAMRDLSLPPCLVTLQIHQTLTGNCLPVFNGY